MNGIIARISDFFYGLFHNDPRELDRRKELRRIYSELKSAKIQAYKKSNREIMTGLAQKLYVFYQHLRQLCEIYSKTINNSDSSLAERYRDYLIEIRLPERERNKRDTYEYENMKERVLNAENPDKELERISKEFIDFQRNITDQKLGALNDEFSHLDKLISLCRFDWEQFFGLFDSSVNLSAHRYKPNFSPVDGKKAVPSLMDLYFILATLTLQRGIETNTAALMERLNPSKADDFKPKLNKLLIRMDKLLNTQITPELILNILKAIKEDPFLSPDVDTEKPNYLEDYKKRLSNHFNKIRDRIQRERNENAIEQDLQSMLGGADLLRIEGYSDEQNQRLNAKKLNSFSHVKPIRILKSFAVAKFEKLLRDQIKRLLAEGFFDNRSFLSKLSDNYYKCEKTIENIASFEEFLKENQHAGLPALEKYLNKQEQGANMKQPINKIVDNINLQAKNIIEQETTSYYRLASMLQEIIQDHKKRTPELIGNIKTIAGNNNQEFMGQIVAGYNATVKFIRIMKRFTILQQK